MTTYQYRGVEILRLPSQVKKGWGWRWLVALDKSGDYEHNPKAHSLTEARQIICRELEARKGETS